MAQYTLSHSEQSKGFTSFWSYIADWFARLDNRMYTIKNGQLWIHNDEANPIMNNFYGTQYGSNIKTIFNDAMTNDKAFKTLILESDEKWDAVLATNYTESTVANTEFNTRESRQFAHIRQNENSDDLSGGAAQGVGNILSINPPLITFGTAPEFVNEGDELYQINNDVPELIGVITEVDGATISFASFVNTPQVDFYAFAKKNARAEGSDVRGYFMSVTLINNSTADTELFGVSTEASKSYV